MNDPWNRFFLPPSVAPFGADVGVASMPSIPSGGILGNLGQNMSQDISDDSMVVMFMASMDTPGIKLICRQSYEFAAAATGSPWDYPLTSRFDENDAIFVFDNAFIPWENVFIHRDVERLKNFYPKSGFFNGFTLQGCTRIADKSS